MPPRFVHALSALVAMLACARPVAGQEPGADRPNPLPLSAFVDSTALTASVRALSLPSLPRGVPSIFEIEFDSVELATVKPLFDRIPAEYGEAVSALIRAHLVVRDGAAAPAYTHLRVRPGPRGGIDRAVLRERLPQVLNGPRIARDLQRLGRESRHLASREHALEYRADVRFRVLPSGVLDPASIVVQVSSGDDELDRGVARIVSGLRFSPARVEGIPVPVWVEQPFFVVVPRRGS